MSFAAVLFASIIGSPSHADTAPVRDVDGDGYADLFVGAPEGLGGNDVRGGYVPGGPGGADPEAGYRIDQDSPGVPGTPRSVTGSLSRSHRPT